MYCNKCGKELKGNEKFCPGCGNSVIQSANIAVTKEDSSKYQGKSAKRKGKKRKYKVLLLFFILLFLVIGGLGLFLWKSGEAENLKVYFVDFFTDMKQKNFLKDEQKNTKTVVSEIRYYNKYGEVLETKKYEYDDLGNMIEECDYTEDGELFGITTYNIYGDFKERWEPKDRRKKGVYGDEYLYSGEWKCVSNGNYVYSSDGKMVESEIKGSEGVTKSEYDEFGKEIVSYCYDQENQLSWKKEFERNQSENKEIESCYITENGERKLSWRTEYLYNENKQIAQVILYDANGKKDHVIDYFYDEHGNCTKRTEYTLEENLLHLWCEASYSTINTVKKNDIKNLTEEDLTNIFYKTGNFSKDWFYTKNSVHLDTELRKVKFEDGTSAFVRKVISENIQTVEDMYELGRNYYTESAVGKIMKVRNWTGEFGALYASDHIDSTRLGITYLDEGVDADFYEVSLLKNNDVRYTLTVSEYYNDRLLGEPYQMRCIHVNGKWVLDRPLVKLREGKVPVYIINKEEQVTEEKVSEEKNSAIQKFMEKIIDMKNHVFDTE